MQHEPGVARSLADPAVDDHVVVWAQLGLAGVDSLELGTRSERGVLGGCAGPRNASSAGNVAAADGAFLWIVRHVEQFAGVLARRANVDERLTEVFLDLVPEGAEGAVVTLDDRIVRRLALRHVC